MPHVGSAARVLVGAAVVLPAVLFTTAAADPLNVVKMTALLLCALLLLVVGATHAITSRQLRLPWGAPAAVAAVLLLSFSVAAVVSPATGSALFGEYGRNSGLLTYAAALTVFAAVILVFDRHSTRAVLLALMLAGSFTAVYGLLQYIGIDAISWSQLTPNPIIAALGNSNFAAGYVAICLPAFLWGAMRTGGPVGWRVVSAAGGALCVAVALLSDAVQGPLAATAGVAVVLAAALLDAPARLRRSGLMAMGLLAGIGLGTLVWGAAGGGPAASALSDTGSRARRWFWEAAFATWRDHPLLGVGLEGFAPFWLHNRSVAAVRDLGGEDVTDAAHSVPLHLLATGGLLLFVAYVAFVGVTGWALVKGLRSLRQQERLLLGGLGGCWVAYQVQSLVSIDQVPLLVTHYALAGAVIVAAGHSRVRCVALPGAVQVQQQHKRARRRGASGAGPTPSPTGVAALAVLAVCSAALAWQALAPLRADLATRDGDLALGRGDGTPALAAYGRATEIFPGEPVYWQKLGQLLLRAEQPERALQAYLRGIDADPRDVGVVRGAARAAAAAGDREAALAYHRRALELNPYSPSTVAAAANAEFQQGGVEVAEELLRDALRASPAEASLWAALGELLAAEGQTDQAREAFTRAIALDPTIPGVAERLEEIGRPTS